MEKRFSHMYGTGTYNSKEYLSHLTVSANTGTHFSRGCTGYPSGLIPYRYGTYPAFYYIQGRTGTYMTSPVKPEIRPNMQVPTCMSSQKDSGNFLLLENAKLQLFNKTNKYDFMKSVQMYFYKKKCAIYNENIRKFGIRLFE